ncbi:MAG: glycoside hydrolase family 2, partial [Candidatus Nephrothrix sp. EaCA]
MPDPLIKMDDAIDLSDQIKTGTIHINIPRGRFAVYGLVKIEGFMKVIQGTPGGRGPVLNHYDKKAVKRFLDKMSDAIQDKIGPLSPYVRSFFADSLETEGANWTSDMRSEFKARRGYDIYPYLPFVLLKIGGMGNTLDPKYPAEMSPEMVEMTNRMRYDFELTKAELHRERFVHVFAEWCKENKIKSR